MSNRRPKQRNTGRTETTPMQSIQEESNNIPIKRQPKTVQQLIVEHDVVLYKLTQTIKSLQERVENYETRLNAVESSSVSSTSEVSTSEASTYEASSVPTF